MAAVLIVDDDFDMRESLRDILEDEGYTVAVAGDGLEALEYLRANPLPKLILLDWMMPRCNGAQFLERKQANPGIASIPVVLLTADIRRGARDRAPPGGAFLTKPVMLPELLATVERFARERVPDAVR